MLCQDSGTTALALARASAEGSHISHPARSATGMRTTSNFTAAMSRNTASGHLAKYHPGMANAFLLLTS